MAVSSQANQQTQNHLIEETIDKHWPNCEATAQKGQYRPCYWPTLSLLYSLISFYKFVKFNPS